MSSHDNHDHHSDEPKAVSFTVPFILAAVTLVVIFMFLSLCDPKKHCECDENCSKECKEACAKDDHSMHPGAEATSHEEHGVPAAEETHEESKDTMAVESAVPAVDDTSHVEHHH